MTKLDNKSILPLYLGDEDNLVSLKGPSVRGFHSPFSMTMTQDESREWDQISAAQRGLLSRGSEDQSWIVSPAVT